MNPYRSDLNLLAIFQAVLDSGSVTKAAERFGITQPAMSNALARLRALFDDPLFVPMGSGMQPTPYALEIAPWVKRGLQEFTHALEHGKAFEPHTSDRTFRFHMTDMGQTRFLPPLLERLQVDAPQVQIEIETLDRQSIRSALEAGRIDFAIGSLPRLSGRGLKQLKFFRDWYAGLMRSDHPLARTQMKTEDFLNAAHAVVRSQGGHHRIIEETLSRLGARIALRVPYFMVIPTIMTRSNLIVMVPSQLADTLKQTQNVRSFTLPVRIPQFDVCLYWHERFDRDLAMSWLRSILIELFVSDDGDDHKR
jgi:DNA-binding transcriptional LysR family regulator